AVLLTHRRTCIVMEHLIAERHERFRRALHEGHKPALTPMEGSHAFSVRIERKFAHPRHRFLVEKSVILCELNQGHFGWIAREGGVALGSPTALGLMR